jgi:disulfide bond formation protein DsbB
MLLHPPIDAQRSAAYRTGGIVLLGAAAVILAALAFEHLGGYVPCALCLQQRYAYYAGIPLLFAALVLVGADNPRSAAALFGLVALGFIANAVLGGYHAGVEWGCSTDQPLSGNADSWLKNLDKVRPVRCDEIPWQFLGLSLAGWNVVASLMLAAGAFAAARRALPGRV